MTTQNRTSARRIPTWVRQLGGVLLLMVSLSGLVSSLSGIGVRLKESQQAARQEDLDPFIAYFTAGAENGGELFTALSLIALALVSFLIGYIGYRLTTGENIINDKEKIPAHREGAHTGHQRLRNVNV